MCSYPILASNSDRVATHDQLAIAMHQRCNWVIISIISNMVVIRVIWVKFCLGQKWVSPGHTNMPDPNQKYLVIKHIKNCNIKMDTL